MFILKVRGARNATLAYHKSDSYAEIEELIAVYLSLGHDRDKLIVENVTEHRAA